VLFQGLPCCELGRCDAIREGAVRPWDHAAVPPPAGHGLLYVAEVLLAGRHFSYAAGEPVGCPSVPAAPRGRLTKRTTFAGVAMRLFSRIQVSPSFRRALPSTSPAVVRITTTVPRRMELKCTLASVDGLLFQPRCTLYRKDPSNRLRLGEKATRTWGFRRHRDRSTRTVLLLCQVAHAKLDNATTRSYFERRSFCPRLTACTPGESCR
jgi:hypothetical protein